MKKSAIDCRRPSRLFRYGERHWLERSLTLGEFRLRPASDYKDSEPDLARLDDEITKARVSSAEEVKMVLKRTGEELTAIGPVKFQWRSHTDYLTLCLSKKWDHRLFDEFVGSDACLVIHNPEEFGERMHQATEQMLPNWTGFDIWVDYVKPHPLGIWFSKIEKFASQEEWRFA